MFGYELSSWIVVGGWSIAAVGVGIVCGFFIGRGYTLFYEPKKLRKDREKTLEALVALMASTEQLNVDVDTHNSELQSVHQEVMQVTPDSEMAEIQEVFLANISKVIASNRRLENDLIQTRYDMEYQAQELDRTRKEARTDVLCSLGNRKAYAETLQYMLSRFQSKRKQFGLVLIDIDHFKRINDTFGHTAGDQVLVSVSSALKDSVRPDDFVGRLGGDEFAIILKGLNEERARSVGERIHSQMGLRDFSVGNDMESTVVTLSMGLTVVLPEDTPLSLYERADRALYRSKELGRNRLCTLVGHEAMEFEQTKSTTSCEPASTPVG